MDSKWNANVAEVNSVESVVSSLRRLRHLLYLVESYVVFLPSNSHPSLCNLEPASYFSRRLEASIHFQTSNVKKASAKGLRLFLPTAN